MLLSMTKIQLTLGRLLIVIAFSMTMFANIVNGSTAIHDDVIDKLVMQRLSPPDTLLERIDTYLQESVELLDNTLAPVVSVTNKAQSVAPAQRAAQRTATGNMLIESKVAELEGLRDEVMQRMASYRQRMNALDIDNKRQEWDALAVQIDNRFDYVSALLTGLSRESGSRRIAAIQSARDKLQRLRKNNPAESNLSTAFKPTERDDLPLPEQPLTVATQLPKYLSNTTNSTSPIFLSLAVIDETSPPAVLPPESASCGTPTEINAALAATQDVIIDQEIMDLAASLDYSPAKILEYIYHQITFEPYYGSLKGSKGALVSGRGNDTDQASLMIALLRASNIPARYVKGKVEVTDTASDPLGGRIAHWLGAKGYVGAGKILSVGKNPSVTTLNSGGQPIGVRFAHVWVEACVPYDNYRGTAADNSGFRWVPLDGSFTDSTYQAGIVTSVSFDYSNYFSARTFDLPYEALEDQIVPLIQLPGILPYETNNTLLDVPYSGQLIPFNVDILPATLPYEVSEFLAWDGTASAEADVLPDSHRYKYKITFTESGAGQLFTTTLTMSDILLGRVTLSFEGATPADQTLLSNWQTDGTLPTTPTPLPCTVNVVPVLKGTVAGVEGQDIATGPAGSPLGLCSGGHDLLLEITLAELANPDINDADFNDIDAASYHALQAYGFQASERLLSERASMLLETVSNTVDPNTNLDATEGEFLHIVGLKYMHDQVQDAKRIGELLGSSGLRGLSIGLAASEMKVAYVFDIPFAVARNGYFIDVPGGQARSRNLVTGETDFETFLLTGHNMSALEHVVWQENTRLDAISTVRGIQFAGEQGIAILVLDSTNWDAAIAGLSTNPGCTVNATLNYPQCVLDSIKSGLIDQGFTLTMPASLVQYGDWKGNVFVAYIDNTGNSFNSAAAFTIGKYSGGYTLRPSGSTGITGIPMTTYDPVSDLGYVTPNPDAVYAATPPAGSDPQPLVTNSGPLNNGFDANFTVMSGNINTANGNMAHAEQDISVPFSQDIGFNFTRMYNARNPKDGPLGFGWTHNYNQTITFIDHDANNTVDAADSDGLTSSVGWTDASGGQKLFTVSGTAGGVAIGSTFTRAPGVFATMSRNGDGSYSIREKNGVTYNFENVAGTLSQVARLLSITDRNGNALTLNYNGSCNNNLCSITDDASRALNFSYDANDRIVEIVDWTGRQFQYGYTDGNNNLNSYENPLAVAGSQPPVTYQYFDANDGAYLNHALKTHTKARGNSITYEYYANGRTFRKTDALGGQITYRYNDFRRETTEINKRGYERVYRHDQYGNMVELMQEDGAVIKYTFDTSVAANVYNRIGLQSPEGYLTQYQYDTNGNVTKITNPSGSTIEPTDYNAFSQAELIKDQNGNYSVYQFDANGNLLQSIDLTQAYCTANDCSLLNPASYLPAATDMIAWTVYAYDSDGHVTEQKRVRDFAAQVASPTATSETGQRLSYAYDGSGLYLVNFSRTGRFNNDVTVSTQTAPISYDSLGRLVSGVDGNWYANNFEYDLLGRAIKGTDRVGQLRDFNYDDNNNRVSEKLQINSVLIDSRYAEFDLLDRRIKSVDAGGSVFGFTYDEAGNLTRITDPDGGVTRYTFNPINVVTDTYNPLGHVSSRQTDGSRRLRKATDQNGLDVVYDYFDASGDGRLREVTGALGHSILNSYDANGNVIEKINVGSDTVTTRSTITDYDAKNRRVRQVGPVYSDALLGSVRPVNQFVFDALGSLTQVSAGHTPDLTGSDSAQDVVSIQTTFAYDDFQRRINETDALGREWVYSFDTNNNLANTQDPESQLTTYTWGYGQQLLTITDDDAQLYSYTRNELGQVETAESPDVTYQYSFDASQRLNQVVDNRNNKTLNYAYSPGGKLNSLIDSDGNRTDYLYDPAGNLTGIWAPSFDFIGFNYDPAGRMTNKWMFSGANTAYSYNDDNTVASMTNSSGVLPISSHAYSYDVLANRSAQAEMINGSTINYVYSYDALNRLIQVDNGTAAEQQVYEYDPLNNRTFKRIGSAEQAYVYDVANQLQEIRNSTPAGALLANLIYDLNGNLTSRTDTNASYIYDARDQLVQVNIPSELSQFYNYDDRGRRVSKTIGTLATQYLYNGDTLINEYDGLTGNSQAYYTHGARLDEVLINQTPTDTYYYHSDALNSVVSATNALGIIQSTAQFDAWGNTVSATGAAQHFGYTGREPDETGLTYYRARYYDADLGRFTQRDPIGLQGGVNRYAYVLNSPVNFTDPFGLDVLIQIGFTNTGVPGTNHQLVILTDTITNQQYATRAGPESQSLSDFVLNVGFGDIHAQAGTYDADFRDSPADVHTIQDVGVIERDYSDVIENAVEFARVTNENNINYDALGPNSNSYASTFVESLTGTRPDPVVSAQGHSLGTPDSDLSYSPTPIIAGGAYSVGNIFQQ